MHSNQVIIIVQFRTYLRLIEYDMIRFRTAKRERLTTLLDVTHYPHIATLHTSRASENARTRRVLRRCAHTLHTRGVDARWMPSTRGEYPSTEVIVLGTIAELAGEFHRVCIKRIAAYQRALRAQADASLLVRLGLHTSHEISDALDDMLVSRLTEPPHRASRASHSGAARAALRATNRAIRARVLATVLRAAQRAYREEIQSECTDAALAAALRAKGVPRVVAKGWIYPDYFFA